MSLDVFLKHSVRGFSLDVSFCSHGKTLGILGASGSGKSMTLGCIAGLVAMRKGKITARDRVLFDSAAGIDLKPQQRKIGYLFQNYALFPHMNVQTNIGCALPRGANPGIVAEWIRRLRLEGLEGLYPGQLSGGQQQRVALARILVREPETLLLDEPFSALDYHLKERLQVELLELLEGYAGNIVLVTHSRDEVYRLCERLVVLEQGRSVACGDTKAMFQNPGLLLTARLTGCKNLSRAQITGENTVYALDWGMDFTVAPPIPNGTDYIGIRAHHFKPAHEAGGINYFPVNIISQIEDPFEWNTVFAKKGAPQGQGIWWKAAKDGYMGPPDSLHVRPQDVLLLRSSGPDEAGKQKGEDIV